MKPFLISIGVICVCFLENIGHYFGICLHGVMSQFLGSIAICLVSLGLYSRNVSLWLKTRKSKTPHKCKEENHHHVH